METQQYQFTRHLNYSNKDDDNPFYIKFTITQRQWKRSRSRTPAKNKQQSYNINMPSSVPQNTKKQSRRNKNKRNIQQQLKIDDLKQYAFVNANKLQKKVNKQKQRQQRTENRLLQQFAYNRTNQKDRHQWVDQQQSIKPNRNKNKGKNKMKYLQVPSNQQQLKMKRATSINIENKKNKNQQAFKYVKPSFAKGQKKKIYDNYQSIDQIQQSRQNNEQYYFRGTIDCDQRLKSFVRIQSTQVQGILVAQGPNRNRAIHGDEIYFIILEKGQQKTKCKIVYILSYQQQHGKKRQIIGRIELIKSKNIYILNPINKRFVSFNIKLNEIDKEWLAQRDKKYFIGNFVEWAENQEYPQCLIVGVFGDFGSVDVQTGALLKMYSIYDEQYTQEQIQQGLGKFIFQADQKGEYKISQQQIKKRTDLRQERIFTIDPLTARDFDDALSIKTLSKEEKQTLNLKTQKELYEIGVHIADASFFVEEDGIIDQQAKIRTTSVYLVHRVLPMLPRILCQTMCSLNPGLQRLTLSVWFYIDQDGQIFQNCRYDRSVIKSKARFTYQQAQKIIKDQIKSQNQIEKSFGCVQQKDYEQVSADIKLMNKIAQKTKLNRVKSGALVFQIPKKSFILDEKYHPIGYKIQQRFQAHFLVEQFMLLANQKVAQVLVKNVGPAALLRRHKFPGEKKIEKFEAFMKKIGQQIKIKKGMNIQDQVNLILQQNLRASVKSAIKYQMIFLLELADYFLVNKVPEQEWVHYALNMKAYTHFTSPIRRYPDIIVHRLLIAVIQAQKQNLKQPKVPKVQDLSILIERCNKNKLSAKKVSSNCQKIFLCLYLKDHPVQATAILVTVDQWGFKISVPNYDIRTSIELRHNKKVNVLKVATDNNERKYVELEYAFNDKQKIKVYLKELQEIDVKLTATDAFPIDYKVKLLLPNPKNPMENIILE